MTNLQRALDLKYIYEEIRSSQHLNHIPKQLTTSNAKLTLKICDAKKIISICEEYIRYANEYEDNNEN